jgi:hypothetical protein
MGERDSIEAEMPRVLHQLELLTEKTKGIEAQIGHNVWHQQTVWVQKRECYFNLLEKTNILWQTIDDIRMLLTAQDDAIGGDAASRLVAQRFSTPSLSERKHMDEEVALDHFERTRNQNLILQPKDGARVFVLNMRDNSYRSTSKYRP